jgi:hypothetical protein
MSQSASNQSLGRTQRAVRHKHVIQAVHIQWRAALLAIIACATVLFYWVSREDEKYNNQQTMGLTRGMMDRSFTLRKSVMSLIFLKILPSLTAGSNA